MNFSCPQVVKARIMVAQEMEVVTVNQDKRHEELWKVE